MALRSITKMLSERVDWYAQPREQHAHGGAAATPALGKLWEKARGSGLRDLRKLWHSAGFTGQQGVKEKEGSFPHWRADPVEAGPFHTSFLRVPAQLQETQVVAFLGHNREDTTRG